MGLEESMSGTAQGLKKAKTEGGFFYIVVDSKGVNAALMALGIKKDADGKKTFRMGRSLLKEFKTEYGAATYSQGSIEAGSSLVFSITKGNAKPGTIKRAFKNSKILRKGVGDSVLGLLKSAKIVMGGKKKKATNTEDETTETTETEQQDRSQALDAWRLKPENARLIADIGGMTEEDIADLYDAQMAFADYQESLPQSSEEQTNLELAQAETESTLLELIDGYSDAAELLNRGDTEGARAIEEELNNKRVEMARSNASGTNPFQQQQLSNVEQEALNAVIHTQLEMMLSRATEAQEQFGVLKTSSLDRTDLQHRAIEIYRELQVLKANLEFIN